MQWPLYTLTHTQWLQSTESFVDGDLKGVKGGKVVCPVGELTPCYASCYIYGKVSLCCFAGQSVLDVAKDEQIKFFLEKCQENVRVCEVCLIQDLVKVDK